MQITAKDEMLCPMAKQYRAFGKFVRLNLIGAIVEVVDCNSTEIIVNYKGTTLRMSHYEVSRITPEESAAAEKEKRPTRSAG
jgi:hypothetical protein